MDYVKLKRGGEEDIPDGNATIESRRFEVETQVEGISAEGARRELRLPRGWAATRDGSLRQPPQAKAGGLGSRA